MSELCFGVLQECSDGKTSVACNEQKGKKKGRKSKVMGTGKRIKTWVCRRRRDLCLNSLVRK